jgi:hypothetical protein
MIHQQLSGDSIRNQDFSVEPLQILVRANQNEIVDGRRIGWNEIHLNTESHMGFQIAIEVVELVRQPGRPAGFDGHILKRQAHGVAAFRNKALNKLIRQFAGKLHGSSTPLA